MKVQVENGACSRGDRNMFDYQSSITTSWMTFVVLLTTLLAICIFLYNVTGYMPMLRQPKPKVRTGSEKHAH